MALRFPFGILLFYLLLLKCDSGNGARDVVAKQAMKHVELVTDRNEVGRETKEDAKDQLDQSNASGTRHNADSGYGATPYGTKLDVDHPSYAATYRTKQDGKDSGYKAAYGTKLVSDYAASYRTKQDAEDSGYKAAYGTKLVSDYAASYRTKQDAEDSGYKAAYGTKLVSDYAASYRTKQDAEDSGYKAAYGTKLVSDYAASYRTKQDAKDSSYKAAYGTKLVSDYAASYRTKQYAKDSGYKAAYGTKLVSDYTAAYQIKQDAKDSGYKATYGTKLDVDDSSYAAAYQAKRDAKDSSYKAAYGTKQDSIYEAAYGIIQEPKDSGYKAAYGTKLDVYDSSYTTAYQVEEGTSETKKYEHRKREAKQNYMAAYGTKEVLKNSGMEHKGHCGQIDGIKSVAKKHLKEAAVETEKEKSISAYGDRDRESKASVMVHENHDIPAKRSSSHVDHLEAFKSGLFTMDDLHLGKIMPLRFPIRDFPQFLPREEADSIPFSMLRLPNVLQLFSVHPDSPTAKAMEDTLRQCEAPPIKGEIKLCPTSLESMLDFVHSVLGSWTNLDVLTTTLPTMSTVLTQNYTISRIAEQVQSRKWVVCHPFPYPYKVFYCHFMERSKLFKVSLGGENGHEVEAVAVCHMDTSDWDPDSIIFRKLGVKPGPSSPVCHFLPVNHLVWVPSPTAAAASA